MSDSVAKVLDIENQWIKSYYCLPSVTLYDARFLTDEDFRRMRVSPYIFVGSYRI